MKSLEDARRLFMERVRGLRGPASREMRTADAQGEILALPVIALFSSPACHASAMDGYAVEASKTYAARENNPVDLKNGIDVYPVDTGDALPEGCNAVIMAEDAHYRDGGIRVLRSWSPWENVRLMGEDVVAGEILLPAGKRITPYDIGLCLAGGQTAVMVMKRPVVGIMPTGDELIEPGTLPKAGEIVEFNSAVLAALARERGAEVRIWPVVPDKPELLMAAVEEMLPKVDVLVISAGSSAGRDDYTSRIIEEMGELMVHGVSIMPGKPTALGMVKEVPVVGLPGYPASAVVSFEQFVLPVVDYLLCWEEPEHRLTAVLSRDLPSRAGHAEFIRGQAARVGGRLVMNPLPRGASLISSYARANAVAEVPAEAEGVERGEDVRIRPLTSRPEIERSFLLAGSHDLCLEILRDELLRPPGRVNLMISTQGSLGGLILLADGYAHLATCHLLDPETGTYNRPYVERFLPGRKVRLLHVALREQGLMVKEGNPKGIHGLRDLSREDVIYINRQRGSGTRILLDHLLEGEKIDPQSIRGYQREEINHMTVAAAVSGGLADAGTGILSAALALGLDFIPLAREMFDLVITEEVEDTPLFDRVANIVASKIFKRRLESLGGYDTGVSGTVD